MLIDPLGPEDMARRQNYIDSRTKNDSTWLRRLLGRLKQNRPVVSKKGTPSQKQ